MFDAQSLRNLGYVEVAPGDWQKPKFLPTVPGEPDKVTGVPVDRERKLHEEIMEWCDGQWPRWKYCHSRMDMKSTIQVGWPDFTVFGPHPLCILVECKKKDGKLDDAQRDTIAELKRLGWEVKVAYCIEDFHRARTEAMVAIIKANP